MNDRFGLDREAQIRIAEYAASFLVEKYLADPTRTPQDPAVTIELLRDLAQLAKTRFAAYAALEHSICNAEHLGLAVARLRMMPPYDPPTLMPATSTKSSDAFAKRVWDNLDKSFRDGRQTR